MCKFVTSHINEVFKLTQVPEVVKAVTGWGTSLFELMKVGEKAPTTARVLTIREGFTSKDYSLPDKFFTDLENGLRRGQKMDKEDFKKH